MKESTNIDFLDLNEQELNYILKILRKYLMGIVISKTSGSILYHFEVDHSINTDLFSQFIAALAMFGEELGNIRRILIEGLNLEMNSLVKNNLIITAFFRPDMVTDYLEEEASKCLDEFSEKFADQLEKDRCNQDIYKCFDKNMWELIQDYLIRIGAFDLEFFHFTR
ncbi:MAG: hypothetical protein GF364_15455 [Candidatus Lokiarchaeota archaeon]|nr:hypothetical protein [Candidatus Lokiarchaeota archaeon]